MATQRRVRKTCDLCYNRKLKCDREKPRCSNCISYGSLCLHTAPSRKWKAKPRRDPAEIGWGQPQPDKELQARKAAHNQAPLHTAIGSDIRTATRNRTEKQLSIAHRAASTTLSLPPLEHTMVVVGYYLNNLNPILPLFDGNVLLSYVGECYGTLPPNRDPTVWAAINVVLAVTYQHIPKCTDPEDPASEETDNAMKYITKAQAVVSELLLGETSLLNAQTLIGMVMVLQTGHDVKPALMLISATMRLVHRLGLHSRAASAHLDPAERQQHNNVFWLAYILDKSLSLRARQPSIQLDEDIDIDLPGSTLSGSSGIGNHGGMVLSTDARAHMAFLLARVQLANVEGAVYDSLYSNRARNRSLEERAAARESVVAALETWESAVPPPFRASVVADKTGNAAVTNGLFCVLHSVSFQCITMINQAHAWDEKWIVGLQEQNRGLKQLQLPSKWGSMVEQARGVLTLFRRAWSEGVWFQWMISCAYITAMVVLIANESLDPKHSQASIDDEHIAVALRWLDERIKEGQSKEVETVRDICREAVEQVRRKRDQLAAAQQAQVSTGLTDLLQYSFHAAGPVPWDDMFDR